MIIEDVYGKWICKDKECIQQHGQCTILVSYNHLAIGGNPLCRNCDSEMYFTGLLTDDVNEII